MKKIILVLIAALLIALGYVIYQKYFSDAAIGNSIFERIENGKISYYPTIDGMILVDNDLITSDIMVTHILLSGGSEVNYKKKLLVRNELFVFPNSIRKYEYISSSKDTMSFLKETDVSEAEYQKYWYEIYKTYNEYVTKQLKLYSRHKYYVYDTTQARILYLSEPYKRKTLKYKVETPIENFLCQLVFVNEYDGYKLAAFFCTRN